MSPDALPNPAALPDGVALPDGAALQHGVAPPDRAALPDHVREFLAAPRYATIATVAPDGQPRQAVIWYRLEPDERILLNSRSPRRWPSDLIRDGRFSLAVIDEQDGRRWLGLTCRVETVIDEQERARQDIVDLAHRYDGPDADVEEFLTQERVTFLARIVRVHEHFDE